MEEGKQKGISEKRVKDTDALLETLKQHVQNGSPQKDDPNIKKTKDAITQRIGEQREKQREKESREREERESFDRKQREEYDRHQAEIEELRRRDRERETISLEENKGDRYIQRPRDPTRREKFLRSLKRAGNVAGPLSLFLIPTGLLYGAYRFKVAADADYSTYSSEGTVNLPIDGSKTIDGGSCQVTDTGAGVNGVWGFLVRQLNTNNTPTVNWHNIGVGSLFTDNSACQDSIKVHLISVAPNGTATLQIFANNASGGAGLWGGAIGLFIAAVVSTIIILYALSD